MKKPRVNFQKKALIYSYRIAYASRTATVLCPYVCLFVTASAYMRLPTYSMLYIREFLELQNAVGIIFATNDVL